MALTQTTLYGTGNFFYNTEAQGGVYQNHAFTSPLDWHTAYSAPTPTGNAIVAPTVGVSIPHNLFTGSSSGYWVHTLYLNGHRVGTFTLVDQEFAITVPHDYVESVALPFSPTESLPAVCDHRGDCPSPGGAAVLLASALFVRFRNRKA